MSDDEPTTKVPEGEASYDTKPGITAILERINALDEKLTKQIDDRINALDEKLANQINAAAAELRTEMQTEFRKLGRKLELHAKNLSDLYADERELESRVEKLEEKAS